MPVQFETNFPNGRQFVWDQEGYLLEFHLDPTNNGRALPKSDETEQSASIWVREEIHILLGFFIFDFFIS
jgi:hypothetical protein